jgi:hypothetical protein
MKKSEGELLREYAKIVSEADDQADGFGDWEPHDQSHDYSGDGDNASGEDDMDDWESDDENAAFNAPEDVDEEPEAEINSDDPINDLVSFIEGQDKHTDVPLADQIKKFLHTHNLELTPIGGLSDNNGTV